MKLFVSALFAAAASLTFGQSGPQNAQAAPRKMAPHVLVDDLVAHKASPLTSACPLQLTSAAVAPSAGVLPVGMRNSGDGALALHFRNQSGKAIRSASITAHLKVKTNIYALDARPLEVQLTFSGTEDRDRQADQLARIALPGRVYLFGVATVSLDQVTYADGSFWVAAPGKDVCRVGGAGTQLLEAR